MNRRCTLLAALVLAAQPLLAAEPGHPHGVHALVGARVWVTPDKVVDNATLIVRDGRVEAVGVNLTVPPDARVWDVHGKTIHAGFVDPYVTDGRLRGGNSAETGTDAAGESGDEEEARDSASGGGPTSPGATLHSPVSADNPRVTADRHIEEELRPTADVLDRYRECGFVALQAVPMGGIFRGQAAVYSLVSDDPRQALMRSGSSSVLGAQAVRWGAIREDAYPGSLMGNLALVRQVLADVDWYGRAHQVDEHAYQGSDRPPFAGSLQALQSVTNGSQPLLFETRGIGEGDCFARQLEAYPQLKLGWVMSLDQWRDLSFLRPGVEAIVPVHFSEAPKAQTPGEKLDVNLATLRNWANGPRLPGWVAERTGHLCLTTHGLKSLNDFPARVRLAMAAGLPLSRALDACTREPARLLGLGDRLGTLEKGHAASFVIRTGEPFSRGKIEAVWSEGTRFSFDPALAENKQPATLDEALWAAPAALPEQLHPAVSGSVLIRNVTAWTEESDGVLPGVDILVTHGKIAAIGKGLSANGATVVDATGMHCTPGLIDHHSHSAIWGSVNEATRNTSSEVRTADVLNPFDRAIHDQLAGGVTVAHVLHGSANAIGGQTVTVKWKWGCPARDLVFAGAPGGIKFALGENPKQSNWGDAASTRYPKSRMGVAELIRRRFLEAKAYRQEQADYAAGKRRLPVRPDLALDPLLEILDGKRYVHCHSYRQDEILMLMRLAEEQGFRVRTFQHVLEGYKIASEIARHGAGASTFTDWWAYKLEVHDAIPYNGAILANHGVVVSFNSDSNELARRLGTEMPKAIRYGGLSENEALATLTRNPAQTLGVLDRVGTLKVGKDGDLVLWSGHPLAPGSRCLRTYIEGTCYFDAADEPRRVQALEIERELLLTRALAPPPKETIKK